MCVGQVSSFKNHSGGDLCVPLSERKSFFHVLAAVLQSDHGNNSAAILIPGLLQVYDCCRTALLINSKLMGRPSPIIAELGEVSLQTGLTIFVAVGSHMSFMKTYDICLSRIMALLFRKTKEGTFCFSKRYLLACMVDQNQALHVNSTYCTWRKQNPSGPPHYKT